MEIKSYSCVIFGGTTEGRILAEHCVRSNITVHICVTTKYASTLLAPSDNIHIHCKAMDATQMEAFLLKINPKLCIDATHPYALAATENIKAACHNLGLRYIRLQRECNTGDTIDELVRQSRSENTLVKYVASVDEAAAFLSEKNGNIFIATGSKELKKYTVIPNYESRCFVRVIPAASVIENCEMLGFKGKNIIAMQGPFSKELNSAMLKACSAKFMVTKQSGTQGGFQEKCEAALSVGASLVIVKAPHEDEEGYVLKQVLDILGEFAAALS